MSEGYNAGSGDGAFEADESTLARVALIELREMFQQAASAISFTRVHYPNEPLYVLHQNALSADGYTDVRRKELAMGRYAHAKKAKVGERIACPGCGRTYGKRSYQHVFCKDKVRGRSTCKDFINNWFDPVRLMRALDRSK